ncbi:MAG TPA: hypothetical protein VKP10_02570 [Gemmatimonadales bacterium]|nr:hypothetical protein [Gemmatimonadales bacterium]
MPQRLAAVRVSYRLGLSATLASGALVSTLLVANCNVAEKTGPPPVASQLAFKIDPSTSPAGVVLPPVTVQARDASGKLVSGYSDSVTVTIAVNPANGTLLGTKTVAAVGGVATFTDLSIKEAGTGYRLQANSGTLTPTLSAKFDVVPGPATHLGFVVQPGTSVAGTSIAPAVKVTALDALENSATGFAGSITVAISAGTGTSGATLSGITTATASGGVASFSTLKIDKMGVGYRLAGSTTGLPPVTSDSFDIVAGAASQVVFMEPPATTTAGTVIAPAVQVAVRDAVGNPVTGFAGNVTVSITTGTGTSGASLAGTRTVAVSGGVATFSDLSIARSGTGYTLSARSSGLAGATSPPFDILVGPLSALVFTAQPKTTTAGATLVPVVITAEDAAGNTVTTFGDPVALSISANPGDGTLSGTATQAAVNGVATFGDLSIDSVGTGYRLQAASGALADTSQAFSIRPGGASRLVFTSQPAATTVAGKTISPAVQVSELDSLGNTVTTFTGAVTLAITPGTGTSGASLSGTTTVTAVSGVASFSTLSVDSAGTGYTFTASTDGLPDTVSTSFKIDPGAAFRLEFTAQPTTSIAGDVIAPSIVVTARDVIGNTATGVIGSVTLSITTGTGTAGANLAGTKTVPLVGGVATFSDLSIDQAGSGYTLSARSSGITGTVSDPFDILIGSVTQLVFTQQPTTDTAGQTLTPPVQVTAEDAAGNTVTSFTGNVTVSIAVNPGGGTLSGTKTVTANQGVATFSNLSIDKAGTGYRLQAAVGSLKDTSQAFSILAGVATKLAFTQQPTNTNAGAPISPSVKVAGQDAFGNTSSGFTGNVTVAIGTNPGGGALSGTLTLAAVSGIATFPNLSIDKVGTGYTLKATATGLTAATSTAFNISFGAATQLAFTIQPANTAAGATIPTVKVTALDNTGNPVTTYTGSVTMGFGTNAGGGTLSGTKIVTAISGVATFSTLSIDKSGIGYTLKATATGLTSATSLPFNITAGAASQLVFTSQPVTTTSTTPLAPITVTATDAQGNTATNFISNVTMAIAVNAGGGTLSGTKTVAAVAGVATFNNLSIDSTGTGYRLAATSGNLKPDTSSAFSITAGPATKLVFTVQPSQTGAGGVITPAVKVTAQDAGGNTATSFTGQVTMAIGTNPSGGILSGTKIVNAVAGVATFADLTIDKLGTGYTLRATATGLTAATSQTFNIVAGTATQLAFTTQPTSTVAGATMATVRVTARDAQGNTATGYTGNVTVAIGTNPGGGTLSGTKSAAAVAGVATFTTLSIDKSGTGYTLTAAANGLSGATSSTFNITPAALSQLAFTVDPSSATAGVAITPAVKVAGQDVFGNTVTSFTGSVTIAITPGSGTAGATLSGTLSVNASAGVATFSNLSIDKAGADYHLTATSGALTSAPSAIFAITAGAATHVSFDQQPTSTTVNTTIIPAVTVSVRDAFGNIVKTFGGNVAVVIGTNPGGGTLNGTKTVAAVAGVATFSTLSINAAGTGYTLVASSGALTTDTSSAFSIN